MTTHKKTRRRRILRGATWVVAAATAAVALGAFQSRAHGDAIVSPLAAYPGFGHDPIGDENRFNQEEQRRENMIADCMQRQGFFYAPATSTYDDGSMTAQQAWDASSADPNSSYTSSLSSDEWRAYSQALASVDDANDPGPAAIGGCIGAAQAAVPGVFAAYNELREPFEAMQRNIAIDPQVLFAKFQWLMCMLKAGFWSASTVSLGTGVEDTESAAAAVADGETEVAASSGGGTIDLDALAERVMAAGESCGIQVGLDQTIQTVSIRYETAFVDQYRDVLDAFKAQEG